MEKIMKRALGVFGCALAAFAGVLWGYDGLIGGKAALEKPAPARVESAALTPVSSVENPKITTETLLVYEYAYAGDGALEREEEPAPYYLLNMDENRVRAIFADWEILSFSGERVVLRRTLEGESPELAEERRYVIGLRDGFVTVFYHQPQEGGALKEVTRTPVSALSAAERERLERGIIVTGEEALLRALENYES